MKKYIAVLVVIMFLGSSAAQNFVGELNPFPVAHSPEGIQSSDTVKILAVMVDFQEDRDNATFGNGKFGSMYTQEYGNDILDPLPHDINYFGDHLLFVQNYFKKVSNDQFNIEYTILPDIVTVSQTMRNYSPPPDEDDLTPLGQFAEEVWSLVNISNPSFDFGSYSMFLIFHAGVGRDINLPGSIGLERDLPSVYLSLKAFKEIFGQEFNGFQVNNKLIQNTAVLPSTESREISVIGGTVLLELTINGLIAASVGSHLGLPDLFDTETGLSAIGRFGLMDGQSIFAYAGTFPPEPSPWEKLFLGWISPAELNSGGRYSLTASEISMPADTTFIKIPINSDEYFLLENRVRDARKDGATVTYKVNGNVNTITFPKDTTGFLSFDVDSLKGVIIDVDEFDWAVPGNGVVIWHIDNNIINANIEANSINIDKFARGVDVEEADGIQDIGEEFVTIFGDVVVGEGTEDDFWFSSNEATLYKNVFDKNSQPNTASNTGANSLISISEFSDTSNVLFFTLRFGDGDVSLKSKFDLNISDKISSTATLDVRNTRYYYFISDSTGSVYKYDTNGQLINTFDFSRSKVALIEDNGIEYMFGVKDSLFNVYADDGNNSGTGSYVHNTPLTTPPVYYSGGTQDNFIELLAGTAAGELLRIRIEKYPSLNISDVSALASLPSPVVKIVRASNYYAFASGNELLDSDGSRITLGGDVKDMLLSEKSSGNYYLVCLLEGNNFAVVENGNTVNSFAVESSVELNSFSLADLFNDGNNYILLNKGNSVSAYNLSGAPADNFPYRGPLDSQFLFAPLSADLNGDDRGEIISIAGDGRLIVVSPSDAADFGPFPIAVGSLPGVSPRLFIDEGRTLFSVLNTNGEFLVYNINSGASKLYYAEENGDRLNRSYVVRAGTAAQVNEFFPEDRAYNWPNPVYGGETFIRFYVAEESSYEIKIFDLAGDLVSEMNGKASGGLDNEVAWNVDDIQSGVYFARINVEGSAGSSSEKIIKIAVIK
jgi:hypothetical protein